MGWKQKHFIQHMLKQGEGKKKQKKQSSFMLLIVHAHKQGQIKLVFIKHLLKLWN